MTLTQMAYGWMKVLVLQKIQQLPEIKNRATGLRKKLWPDSLLMKKEKTWQLRLYIAGQTPKSVSALKNIKKYCEEHLKGQYSIEIIDLLKDPQLAEGDQIFAIPTLVRKVPAPLRKIIGDLSNKERVLVGLNIRPIKLETKT